MENRCLSLDFLRGISIFGMIFSAIIPYGVLPAWMYHIQNPPPLHNLDVTVSGIGWVDLVFPVFIFCMGVAIPLSGKKKMEQGVSAMEYVKGCFGRFLMLWLFSYLYVLMNFSTAEGLWPQIFTIFGFVALGSVYGKRVGKGLWMRVIGLIIVGCIITIGHFGFGEVVSFHRRGIIIFLLAFLYLFGSLIWYSTRRSLKTRVAVFIILFLFTCITKELEWPAITYANPNIRWWFNMEYFYFLLILLPATVIGDILSERAVGNADAPEATGTAVAGHLFFPLVLCFCAWQCYALYMGMHCWNAVVSIVFSVIGYIAVNKYFIYYKAMFGMACILLLCGLGMIGVEGGIFKVPCTVSYCFITFGISVYLYMFSDYLCRYLGGSFIVRVFSGAGKNPLMSYVAFDSLVVPFLKATGLIALYQAAYPAGYPAVGVLRGAIVVFFTMWIVYALGKKGFRWKA